VAKTRQPATWDWPVVRSVAAGRRGVTVGIVLDGDRVCGLITGRINGPRIGRREGALASVFDVDSLVSSGHAGIVLEEPTAPQLLEETIVALRAAVRRDLGRRVTAMIVRQVLAGELPALTSQPCVVREGGAIAVFRNRFDSFDGYLASLSRKRRGDVRRIHRAFAADEEVVVAHTATGDEAGRLTVEDMQRLHAEVVARNHTRRWLPRRLLTAGVARAQLDHPGVERLTYHDRTGRLLAYALTWNHDVSPILGGWGMASRDQGGPRNAWFHQATTHIRWCIESGRPQLVGGQGSLQDKIALGCDLERQWAVLTPLWGR
ncbi:MAG: GNAT family N-acetyltransferase, partial [Nocardioides sp.]|nr:GNAT family N-acetyltransferase [Nocardioides sp.]